MHTCQSLNQSFNPPPLKAPTTVRTLCSLLLARRPTLGGAPKDLDASFTCYYNYMIQPEMTEDEIQLCKDTGLAFLTTVRTVKASMKGEWLKNTERHCRIWQGLDS